MQQEQNFTEEVPSPVGGRWGIRSPAVIGATRTCDLSRLTSDPHDQVSPSLLCKCEYSEAQVGSIDLAVEAGVEVVTGRVALEAPSFPAKQGHHNLFKVT